MQWLIILFSTSHPRHENNSSAKQQDNKQNVIPSIILILPLLIQHVSQLMAPKSELQMLLPGGIQEA